MLTTFYVKPDAAPALMLFIAVGVFASLARLWWLWWTVAVCLRCDQVHARCRCYRREEPWDR